jgi:probable F420-dependent oxidoreductase
MLGTWVKRPCQSGLCHGFGGESPDFSAQALHPSLAPGPCYLHRMHQAAGSRLRLGIAVEGSIFPLDQQHRLIEVARLADEAGVDDLALPEHVLVGSHASEQDPWSSWEPHHLDMPWAEPLLTLAAMAGVTRRLRLVAAAVIAPLRPAGLLAKMAATLHALSQGRFVMGVTPSWHRQEYEALGVPFERRGRILEDTIGACRALWEGAPASFHSPTVSFQGMYCQPRPAPSQRIPVWFTGKFTPRLVRRVAALGDGWMPYGVYGMTLEQKAAAIEQMRERFTEVGRDPAQFEVSDGLPAVEGSLARTMEQVPAMAAAGIGVVRVPLRRFVRDPAQVPAVIDEMVTRFDSYRRLTPGALAGT